MERYRIFGINGSTYTVYADNFTRDNAKGEVRFWIDGGTVQKNVAIFELENIVGFIREIDK